MLLRLAISLCLRVLAMGVLSKSRCSSERSRRSCRPFCSVSRASRSRNWGSSWKHQASVRAESLLVHRGGFYRPSGFHPQCNANPSGMHLENHLATALALKTSHFQHSGYDAVSSFLLERSIAEHRQNSAHHDPQRARCKGNLRVLVLMQF